MTQNEADWQQQWPAIMLRRASEYAAKHSTCEKVRVGAIVVDVHGRAAYGANETIPGVCKGRKQCEVDGHCVETIHAEIDAMVRAKTNLYGGTLYVTRYPCEACARAIVVAGIKRVCYGRKTPISAQTARIFEAAGVMVTHVSSYQEEDAGHDQS